MKYDEALIRTMEQGKFSILYAIKAFPVIARDCSTDVCMSLADMVFQRMREMTPREFMLVFPVDKRYDGDKHGEKDYFSVIGWIKRYGIDREIEKPEHFLMEYMNSDTDEFIIDVLDCMGKLYTKHTGRSMMTDGMEVCGMEYTVYNSDFTWVTHYDGGSTKVTMPNFPNFGRMG